MYRIGSFGFDVLEHGTRFFEDRGVSFVDRRFLVALYDADGLPMAWHPHDPHDGPAPHIQLFRFVGRAAIDVYENKGTDEKPQWEKAGTKPGGDFRASLWETLTLAAEKARVSAVKRRSIRELSAADLQKPLMVEPVNLRSQTLDDAARELTKREIVRDRR